MKQKIYPGVQKAAWRNSDVTLNLQRIDHYEETFDQRSVDVYHMTQRYWLYIILVIKKNRVMFTLQKVFMF